MKGATVAQPDELRSGTDSVWTPDLGSGAITTVPMTDHARRAAAARRRRRVAFGFQTTTEGK